MEGVWDRGGCPPQDQRWSGPTPGYSPKVKISLPPFCTEIFLAFFDDFLPNKKGKMAPLVVLGGGD